MSKNEQIRQFVNTILSSHADPVNYLDNGVVECVDCKARDFATSISVTWHKTNCKYHRSIVGFAGLTEQMTTCNKYTRFYPIGQHQYGISSNIAIGTFGLGPCIGIVFRDPDTNKSMLAHIDDLTLYPVNTFLDKFRESKTIDVHICGGDTPR